MGSSIRNIFTFNKKSRKQQKQNQHDMSRQSSLSPTSSVASFSTTSTSGPQTPTTPSEQDIRGIFRTLEPYWSFYHPQHQYWHPFDLDQTAALEQYYQQGQTTLVKLANPCDGIDSCTVYFQQQQQQQQQKSSNELNFVMDQTLYRTVAPVWWFEQALPDGSLGMCRFEQRNQVRLETLSEDHTRLSLVDLGLENATCTVIMTTTGQPGDDEEMRGMLYVHHPHPMHSFGQKLQNLYPSPSTMDVSADPFGLSPLPRRGSI